MAPGTKSPLLAHLCATGRDKAAPWLLSLFLALSPVYWLPGVGREVLLGLEWSLFLAALVLVFGTELWKGRLLWPAGVLGPLGFAGILLLWAPGLLQAKGSFWVIAFVAQMGFYLSFFCCFFHIARDGDDVFAIFRRAFLLVALLAGAALVLLALDQRAPCAFDSVYVNGWDVKSTGWGIRLAFSVPAAALFFLPSQVRRPPAWKSLAIVGVVVIIGSQLVSGSRGGLLASVVAVGTLALLRSSKRLAAVATLAAIIMAGAIFSQKPCERPLKIVRHFLILKCILEKNSLSSCADLESLSAYRLQGWILGLEKIAERPFLGHGLRQVSYQSRSNKPVEIHNVWIKWAAYTGVLAPVWLLVMMAFILRAGRRVLRDVHRTAAEREGVAALRSVVVAGLLLAMVEPNIPLGVFQGVAVWWAVAGSLVGFAARPAPPPLVRRVHGDRMT